MTKQSTITGYKLIAIYCILAMPLFAQTTEQALAENADAEQTDAERQVAARAVEMQTMIEGVDIKIVANNELHPTERSKQALLRTIEVGRTNGTREDGSLWLFSHEGIPVAMVELWVRDRSNWGHSLLAVTSTAAIQGRIGENRWSPGLGQGVEFKAVPKSGKVLKSLRLRTGQMRQIARRFKCTIEDPGEQNFSQFRLLTDPIHRYKGGDIADGAIFAFVRGQSNPEVLLFIEAKNDEWQFGLLRCSSNELAAKLDKTEVWRAEQVPGWMGSAKGPFWVVHRNYQAPPKTN